MTGCVCDPSGGHYCDPPWMLPEAPQTGPGSPQGDQDMLPGITTPKTPRKHVRGPYECGTCGRPFATLPAFDTHRYRGRCINPALDQRFTSTREVWSLT